MEAALKRKPTDFAKANYKGFLTLVFAIVVFLFFNSKYSYLLSYQEQGQLFLFSSDYFLERIVVPGGFSRYVGEFLTQFNYLPWLGSLVLAVLIGAVGRLVWLLAKRLGAAEIAFPLSFLPAILVWYIFADLAVMLSYLVALVAALAACLFVRPTWQRTLLALPCLIGFYHLFGTTVYLVTIYAVLVLLLDAAKRKNWASNLGQAVVLMAVTGLAVFASTFFTPYPLGRIYTGIFYYVIPDKFLPLLLHVFWMVPLLCLVMAILPRRFCHTIAVGVLSVVFIAIGTTITDKHYASDVNKLVQYDALVRAGDWDKVLLLAAEEKEPTTMSVACCDLALAVKGKLVDHLFDYPQYVPEGLFLFMQKDNLALNVIGEIFLRIGMVNEAQRIYYDAQESNYSFNRSGRLTARLAEVEIINGQYDVARKYLQRLERSLFYRKWAKEQEALLGDEEALDNHPFYGQIRALRTTDDYLFHPNSIFDILESLYEHNTDNQMAYQYMRAALRLSR